MRLFLREWRRSGAAPLEDSPDLREFLERDLGRHALSIVLVAAQAYQCGSLERLRDRWREDALRLACLPRGLEDRLSSLEV